jgi:hypothetical protein
MRGLHGFGILATLAMLALLAVLAVSCVPFAPTGPGGGDRLVTVREVLADPAAFQGKQVRLRGRGVIMAATLLCPGHVGLDTRLQFWDAAGDLMAATKPAPLPGNDTKEGMQLPVYTATVRIFEGDEGCPGQVTRQRIPYLEVTGMALP